MTKLAQSKRHPMYFKGQQQSDKFARGAWAASGLVARLQAHDPAKWSSEQITAALAGKFSDNVAKGGDYSRGFVTAMVECLAFEHCVGAPNFDVWRPLEMELRYTTRRSYPTPGSKLYELDHTAVSVAPDLTVYEWFGDDGSRIEWSAAFLARVQKHGVPISQRRFDALRRMAEMEATLG
jgi:hypothetical protein